MKIGLLTFHTANNYGALLQTYATMQALRKIGNECEIINLRRKPRNKIVSYVYNQIFNRNFQRFRDQYLIPQTEQFYEDDDLSILNKRYDCFLVGSDQVWRTRYTGDLALHYFLNFVDNEKPKVSYASSFGIGSWTENSELTPDVQKLLRRFDAISVREDSGVQICNDVFGVKAEHVLDPTLLLDEQNYQGLIKDVNINLPERFAVNFFLDGQSNIFEQKTSKAMQDIYSIPTLSLSIPKINIGNKSFDWRSKDVLEWLYVLRHSEYIITESFHCIVFAIIFKKHFVCIANNRRGRSRLESFLGMLGLDYLLIDKKDFQKDVINNLLNKKIDFHRVDTILTEYKEKSFLFLNKVCANY